MKSKYSNCMEQFQVWLRLQSVISQAWYNSYNSFPASGQMLGLIMCEGLSCLSAPSDHDSALCPWVGVWESTSTYHRRRLISTQPPTSTAPPLAHSQWPSHCWIPPSLLSPYLHLQSNNAWLNFSTQHIDCSDYNTLSTAPPDPFSLSALCPSPCLLVNHHPLCFSMAQSQDPVNPKTWLMELSLLLTIWAPLSCCLRGTRPRTYAWCRPRKLSAGSRYSKTHWQTHIHTQTHIYFIFLSLKYPYPYFFSSAGPIVSIMLFPLEELHRFEWGSSTLSWQNDPETNLRN